MGLDPYMVLYFLISGQCETQTHTQIPNIQCQCHLVRAQCQSTRKNGKNERSTLYQISTKTNLQFCAIQTCFIVQIGTPPFGIVLKQSLNHKVGINLINNLNPTFPNYLQINQHHTTKITLQSKHKNQPVKIHTNSNFNNPRNFTNQNSLNLNTNLRLTSFMG